MEIVEILLRGSVNVRCVSLIGDLRHEGLIRVVFVLLLQKFTALISIRELRLLCAQLEELRAELFVKGDLVERVLRLVHMINKRSTCLDNQCLQFRFGDNLLCHLLFLLLSGC